MEKLELCEWKDWKRGKKHKCVKAQRNFLGRVCRDFRPLGPSSLFAGHDLEPSNMSVLSRRRNLLREMGMYCCELT